MTYTQKHTTSELIFRFRGNLDTMRRFISVIVRSFALISGGAQAQSAAVAAKSATISIIGKGITAITPTSCSVNGGTGSANAAVCQLTATTIPSGQTVTWAITGGTDATKFALTSAGALSVGAADLPVGNYSITVTATAP